MAANRPLTDKGFRLRFYIWPTTTKDEEDIVRMSGLIREHGGTLVTEPLQADIILVDSMHPSAQHVAAIFESQPVLDADWITHCVKTGTILIDTLYAHHLVPPAPSPALSTHSTTTTALAPKTTPTTPSRRSPGSSPALGTGLKHVGRPTTPSRRTLPPPATPKSRQLARVRTPATPSPTSRRLLPPPATPKSRQVPGVRTPATISPTSARSGGSSRPRQRHISMDPDADYTPAARRTPPQQPRMARKSCAPWVPKLETDVPRRKPGTRPCESGDPTTEEQLAAMAAYMVGNPLKFRRTLRFWERFAHYWGRTANAWHSIAFRNGRALQEALAARGERTEGGGDSTGNGPGRDDGADEGERGEEEVDQLADDDEQEEGGMDVEEDELESGTD